MMTDTEKALLALLRHEGSAFSAAFFFTSTFSLPLFRVDFPSGIL